MASQRILLYGDQMLDNLPLIRDLTHRSRRSPLLRRFLREAFDVVQLEANKVGQDVARTFIESDSLLTLSEQNANLEHPSEVVNTTLMCIVRIGELISFSERDPTFLGRPADTTHVGLCVGLLPAAVAAVALDTSQLLTLGLEMVAISFRLATEIVLRSARVETEQGSWAYTLVGVEMEQARQRVDDFNKFEDLPTHKCAFVSAYAPNWTSVSGPPSVLTKLWSSQNPLAQAPRLELPAGAAVHSAHLPCFDMAHILSSPSSFLDMVIPPKTHIRSPCNGEAYSASSMRDMLSAMIQDIDQNPMNLVDTVKRTVAGLRRIPEIDLMVIGPTSHTTSFQTALEEAKIKTRVITKGDDSTSAKPTREGSGLVAVVGFSGKFPGSENIQEFWESLLEGKDFHREIPQSRFDVKEHFDPSGTGHNKTGTPYGCFLDNPGQFDGRLFNVSPREALQMDPLQRLILMSSYEALEMAGYSGHTPSTASKRISTYIGQVTDDWRCVNECEGIDIYYIPGITRAFSSGRINYHFKWEGANYSMDTACASSATAIALACDSLIGRNCDTAVAGGGSILAAPRDYAGLSKGGFLSSTGNCKTFREDADGYCRGEGVGVVVLKRLEDAVADKDNIQAVLSGWSRSYSARATSITQPHAGTQADLYRKVLQQASISPNGVQYVEMHGTGTQSGDKNEMESVLSVFGKDRAKNNPLTVGAVKAAVGHGEAAAGVTSFIKTLMMLRERAIPPQPGAPLKLNPVYPPLKPLNVRIADQKFRFDAAPGSDGRRRLLLNSFDAAGGNTCMVIEDPPQHLNSEQRQDPRTHQVVVCSGRTAKSLSDNQRRLLDYINVNTQIKLSDVAYTSTARRLHHVARKAYSAASVQDLAKHLSADLSKTATIDSSTKMASVIFTFTGQGSVSPGMGKQLFETSPKFNSLLLTSQGICDSLGLPNFLDIITRSDIVSKSMSISQIQLALTSLEIALANLWMSWGVKPSLLIGHSLGEYAALCVSGVLSLTDTLYLVGKRSILLQERCKSGTYAMLAVGASVDKLQGVLSKSQFKSCQVACINAPSKTVVSGPVKELQKFKDHLQKAGTHGTLLDVQYGFHSTQVEPILEEFERAARGVNFAAPSIPIASTLEAGKIVRTKDTFTAKYLARQAREPVDFVGGLQAIKSSDLINKDTLWLEIGPDPVNLTMARTTLDVKAEKLLPSIRSGEENWKTITHAAATAYVAHVPLDWTEYHKHHEDSLRLLELPFYAFDTKNYWASYSRKSVTATPSNVSEPLKAASTAFTPTTALQTLVSESANSASDISAVFSSSLADPSLLAAIRGHVVDDSPICPAGIFYDMALGAAKYLYTSANSAKDVPQMAVGGLSISHPLLAPDSDENQDTVEVTASKSPSQDWIVDISVKARQRSSPTLHDHATCQVRFGAPKADQTAVREAKSKMEALVAAAAKGEQLRLPKSIAYKLFASLVKYKEPYQMMEEVYLNDSSRDAAASVRLSQKGTGNFTCNPYWVDAVVHLAGFVLNGDVSKPDKVAYISTGFKELSIFQELKEGTKYTSYSVFESEEKKGSLLGNVYVFKGQELVAICAGLTFQKMTKRALRYIFGKDRPQSDSPKSALPTTSPTTTIDAAAPATNGNESESTSIQESKGSDIAQNLLTAVAKETGYSLEDMEPSTEFSDMGVDSLMSIAIVSAMKKQFAVDIPASFFQDCPTVADVTNHFATGDDAADDDDQSIADSQDSAPFDQTRPASTSSISDQSDTEPTLAKVDLKPETLVRPTKALNDYTSTCILVQGRSTSTTTPLFLIADGAGSAAAYIHLPSLPKGTRMYALESPFLTCPQELRFSIEEIATLYIRTLRTIQPHGPYMLGGWSAGAAYAYEVSRQLLEQGERVLSLVLIDMRVPKPMPDGVEPTMGLIEEAGLDLGLRRAGQASSAIGTVTKEHLLYTVKALMVYTPLPMPPSKRPDQTFIIWAKKGLKERAGNTTTTNNTTATITNTTHPPTADDPTEEESEFFGNIMEDPSTGLKSWFYAKRTNFGPNGWDKLVGEEGIEILTVEGDHFSIVVPPFAKVLGGHLKRAVTRSLALIE